MEHLFALGLNYYKNIAELVLNLFFFLNEGACLNLVSLTKYALVSGQELAIKKI